MTDRIINTEQLNEIKKEVKEYMTQPEILLKELGKAIKAGKIKIDWIEDSEEYNEEEDIKGLYTDTFYLSLIWMDEKKHWKERQTLYKLFPSRKERKEKKAGSWRKEEWWTKELSDEQKEIEKRELEITKIKF